jgi:hypothetical protein
MPAHTKIARGTAGASQSRFGRAATSRRTAGAAGQGRFTRSSSVQRRALPGQGLRRRQPKPSGFKKVLSAVTPAAAAKKAAPSSKKGMAGGVALVAAAAGMAFKNRGKLSELRRKDPEPVTSGSDNTATPPGTPVA